VALGLAAGSYGIASAASGSGSGSNSGSGSRATQSAPPAAPPGASAQHPWGGQRSDETPLTGDTATKVRQVAVAKVGGGNVERVETDADGHAAYEAHIIKQDGSPVTVYVDKQFDVVGVESR
jgi:hypothetical protein